MIAQEVDRLTRENALMREALQRISQKADRSYVYDREYQREWSLVAEWARTALDECWR